MLAFEQANPERCEPVEDEDATQLFGYKSVGQSRLADRFAFVFVPAISNAPAEAIEKRGTILSRLLTAVAEQRAAANEGLKAIATYEAFIMRTAWHEWGHALSVVRCSQEDVATGRKLFDLAPAGLRESIRRAAYRSAEYTHELVAETYALLLARHRRGAMGRPSHPLFILPATQRRRHYLIGGPRRRQRIVVSRRSALRVARAPVRRRAPTRRRSRRR
jgi:hypothetical protein